MRVFSGKYCFCDVGRKTNEIDMSGNELYTGDIVQLWHGMYVGTDSEEWYPSTGLTVIVCKEYEGGNINNKLKSFDKIFTLGIYESGIQNIEWKVKLVKSHKDIISGEKFIDFGINYKMVECE